MTFFSNLFKNKEKLTKEQIDLIDKKVEETQKKYSQKEKLSAELPKSIETKVKQGKIRQEQGQVLMQREQVHEVIKKNRHLERDYIHEFVKTGIRGFDELMDRGIPKGAATLICGGPGSGKTIMGLQILNNAALKGEKCIYMTFEENEDKLRRHMEDFGWDWKKLEKEGNLVIKRYDPFSITRSVEALLEEAKGGIND